MGGGKEVSIHPSTFMTHYHCLNVPLLHPHPRQILTKGIGYLYYFIWKVIQGYISEVLGKVRPRRRKAYSRYIKEQGIFTSY
jgi:hypothetical protein